MTDETNAVQEVCLGHAKCSGFLEFLQHGQHLHLTYSYAEIDNRPIDNMK